MAVHLASPLTIASAAVPTNACAQAAPVQRQALRIPAYEYRCCKRAGESRLPAEHWGLSRWRAQDRRQDRRALRLSIPARQCKSAILVSSSGTAERAHRRQAVAVDDDEVGAAVERRDRVGHRRQRRLQDVDLVHGLRADHAPAREVQHAF